jgi:hypothetical protein
MRTMNTIHPTADAEHVLAPAETGRSSPAAAPALPHIDQETYLATRGITAGVLLGAGLWVVILTVFWLIFG